jgi:chemotaxis protein CheX
MTTLFTEDLVTEITSSVWTAFLPEEEGILPFHAAPASSTLTGSIHISGTWNGLVSLTCSAEAATRATASMLATPPGEVDPSDVLDVVGELVNIVGGNIKGLLPPPSDLSLPSVTDGSLHVDTRAGAELLVDVHLSWMDEPINVAIWERVTSEEA